MSVLGVTWTNWAVLAAAGLLAGAINTVAGGGSLISFPALVALGYNPLVANVTNAVATVPGYVGGCIGFRTEFADQAAELRRLGVATIFGALLGSVLLMTLPATSFQKIVGWLVLGSAILMLAQPRIRRVLVERAHPTAADATPTSVLSLYAAQFAVAVYGGYFAAGLGVMMLAVLGVFRHDTLNRLNASKTGLSLIVGVVSAVFFAFNAPVAWAPALILAIFSLLGGLAGAGMAQVISAKSLRRIVIAVGFIAGITLLIRK
ncbi:sulfite exporter TauE/SafE family protein [Nocardia sp. NPDC057030]|uniref:sulfite exporter TauE/SafE family protein n=1 Tax=unclassified Nocardia TaxID=2637762 RepID=UPI003626DBB1